MSADKAKRRYRNYDWVVLNATIKCPKRNVSADNFPSDTFAFFFEDGLFCIEVKASGAVVEVAPAQIREARRMPEEKPEEKC